MIFEHTNMIEMDAMTLPKTVEHREAVDVEAMAASARDATEFLKALAHELRLLILCDLLEGEKSVGELESFLDLRQSTVSQQLARLRLEGLVAARREGKTIYYSISNEKSPVGYRRAVQRLLQRQAGPRRLKICDGEYRTSIAV